MLVFKQKEAKVRCDCGEEISVNTQDFDLETETSEHGYEGTHPSLREPNLLERLQV